MNSHLYAVMFPDGFSINVWIDSPIEPEAREKLATFLAKLDGFQCKFKWLGSQIAPRSFRDEM